MQACIIIFSTILISHNINITVIILILIMSTLFGLYHHHQHYHRHHHYYHHHHHYYHHHHAHPHHQQTLCFLGRVRLPPGWQSWPPFKRASALSCSRYHHQDHRDSDDDDDDEADYDDDADDENDNTWTVEITKTVSVKAGPTRNRGGERGKSRHCRCSREDHHDTGLFSFIMLITMITMMQACFLSS